jgi:hypothetical protein
MLCTFSSLKKKVDNSRGHTGRLSFELFLGGFDVIFETYTVHHLTRNGVLDHLLVGQLWATKLNQKTSGSFKGTVASDFYVFFGLNGFI